jgi:hypothetical protein
LSFCIAHYVPILSHLCIWCTVCNIFTLQITGIPFPPFQDPKVRLKREYLDASMAEANVKPTGGGGFSEDAALATKTEKTHLTSAEGISGSEWYSQEALRAVNQAVGRVIRHRFDYGAVLLLDSRFGDQRNQEGMSKWVRPYIQPDDGFGTAIAKLAKFYRDATSDPLLNTKSKSAKDTDAKKKSVKINTGLILSYENDSNASNGIVTVENEKETKINITVVQAATKKDDVKESPRDSSDGAVSTQRDGYIPANRVIKRIELKNSDLKEKLIENNFDCCGNSRFSSSSERPGLNAVFQQPNLNGSEEVQNPPVSSRPETGVWENLEHGKSHSRAAKGLLVKIPPMTNTDATSAKNSVYSKTMTISK